MFKKEIVYDKPIYVGASILDLSKLHMMRFHYEAIAKQFNDYNLLHSDTDSFVYNIYCDDVYKWVQNNKNHFDLSDDKYNKDNTNKKVIGKFKDELNEVPMRDFTGLNPKVYCYQCEDVETRKAKGVSKVVLKRNIKNADYNHVLNTGDSISKDVHAIRSMEHKVYTIKTNKTCLTPYYDKMHTVDINTCVPFGYKVTKGIKSKG
jgi:hypothetical protein